MAPEWAPEAAWGSGSAQTELPEVSWELFEYLAPEVLKLSFLRLPGSYLGGWLQKCLN